MAVCSVAPVHQHVWDECISSIPMPAMDIRPTEHSESIVHSTQCCNTLCLPRICHCSAEAQTRSIRLQCGHGRVPLRHFDSSAPTIPKQAICKQTIQLQRLRRQTRLISYQALLETVPLSIPNCGVTCATENRAYPDVRPSFPSTIMGT